MTAPALVHDALLYASDDEYVAGIGGFAQSALGVGAALLIAVPGEKHELLCAALGELDGRAELADMRQAGRNPARILPFIRRFLDAHSDRPVRFVGEPIWAGRTPAEIVEGVRHEALINQAFGESSAHILCPYDTRALEAVVLDDAARTHPTMVCRGKQHASHEFVDPLITYAASDRPLPEPPAGAEPVSLSDGLASFRRAVEIRARSVGLRGERLSALVIAVNEAAANTLIHADGDGSARIWDDETELVCELTDTGRIDDPLVGRRSPPVEREGGRGVWLINQLCDLVELRSGAAGTVIRIHMRLDVTPRA